MSASNLYQANEVDLTFKKFRTGCACKLINATKKLIGYNKTQLTLIILQNILIGMKFGELFNLFTMCGG